jgi:LmbE family N-acetylglucosaminyl deacetylase
VALKGVSPFAHHPPGDTPTACHHNIFQPVDAVQHDPGRNARACAQVRHRIHLSGAVRSSPISQELNIVSVLIVASHPDDEVLGCGATAAWLARQGMEVTSCILSGDVAVRRDRPELVDLRRDTERAQQILGLRPPIIGKFPNIEFNTVPHVELTRFIELAIEQTGADVIFTHNPGDLNDDHLHTARACQAASRLFQRRPFKPLRALYHMEVLSSTDWSFPGNGEHFVPDAFFPAEDTLDLKMRALAAYTGVMRPFPHPRSDEIVRGLAAYRGGQCGFRYAEAFSTAFRRYESASEFSCSAHGETHVR